MKIIILKHILSRKANKRDILALNVGFSAIGLLIFSIFGNIMNAMWGVGFGLFFTMMLIVNEYLSITNHRVFPGPISLLKIKHGEIISRLNEVSYFSINTKEKSDLKLLSDEYNIMIKFIEKEKILLEDKKDDM